MQKEIKDTIDKKNIMDLLKVHIVADFRSINSLMNHSGIHMDGPNHILKRLSRGKIF